jgi:hypothetical protein
VVVEVDGRRQSAIMRCSPSMFESRVSKERDCQCLSTQVSNHPFPLKQEWLDI